MISKRTTYLDSGVVKPVYIHHWDMYQLDSFTYKTGDGNFRMMQIGINSDVDTSSQGCTGGSDLFVRYLITWVLRITQSYLFTSLTSLIIRRSAIAIQNLRLNIPVNYP